MAMAALSVPKDVLDGFWKLTDAKENVRIDAGVKIVEHAKVRDTFKFSPANLMLAKDYECVGLPIPSLSLQTLFPFRQTSRRPRSPTV
jgi:hypothetical protein